MAGTVTISEEIHSSVKKIVFTWTSTAGGAADGTTTGAYTGKVLALVTDPDGPAAPTDNYDITLPDAEGDDVLQALGIDRDTATTEKVAIVLSGTSLHPVVAASDVLTLTIAGNSVNSAVTVVKIYYEGTTE